MITMKEFDSLWERYNGRIINEGGVDFTFWWSRHKCLNGRYTVDYDTCSIFDYNTKSKNPNSNENFIIEVDALSINTTFEQTSKDGILKIKYTPIESEDTIKLYSIKEAYKYFDKIMAISKKLNMPSFNFDVHNKIAEAESRIIRYRKLHNYAYSQNEIDEYNKKTADIVYKEF